MQLRLSAILGFLAVALGAFGAHGLKNILETNNQLANWHTAVEYHLTHAIALTALALAAPTKVGVWRMWFYGTIIFSGTLYILALSGMKWLGAITPVGGALLLIGWGILAFCPRKQA